MGIEPTTLCLASIRSSQLSYTRIEFAYIKPIFSFCQFSSCPTGTGFVL